MSVFYYALFSWNKTPSTEMNYFTYHKKSNAIMVYIMLIHATVIETIGLHMLVHQWSVILSWGLLLLNVYGVLFFIGEIQAIRLSPFIVKDNKLHMQVGLMKGVVVPFEAIERVRAYNEPAKLDKAKRKNTLDATVKDIVIEKPAYEIILRDEAEVNYLYGFKKKVDRILFNVDDYEKFKDRIG